MIIATFPSEAQHEEFYCDMGKFFASLEIAKELERQVYNKDNTTWYIAYDTESGEVAGFVSVFDNHRYYFVDNLYVLPEYRHKGIAKDLIATVVETHTDNPLKCIACNPYALKIFNNFNFVEYGTNGKYTKLCKY